VVDAGHARAAAAVITPALCGGLPSQTRTNLRFEGAATLQSGRASSESMICLVARWFALSLALIALPIPHVALLQPMRQPKL
jgi:hypothetical protein